MSQIGAAERSAAVFYYKNKVNDNKTICRDTEGTKTEKLIEWAECLEKLIDLEAFDKPINQICTHIRHEAREEFQWNDTQLRYITDCLPSKFKDHSNDPLTRSDNRTLENLNVEVLKPFIQTDNIKNLSKDQRLELHKLLKVAKDRVEFVATDNKEPLVDHEPNREKKSTEPDKQPGYSEEYYAICDQIEDAEEYLSLLQKVKDKLYSNPPHNATKEQHREAATQIRSFSLVLKPYCLFLKSCADEKYSFTLLKHAEMRANIDIRSKHGAAVKAAVPVMRDGIMTDEIRKMTRERAGDEAEEILEWMKNFSDAMKLSAYWQGLADWRDTYSTLNNRIAGRKVDLSPDLSEASIS